MKLSFHSWLFCWVLWGHIEGNGVIDYLITDSDYFNGADEEYGFEEVETQETIIPIDKLEQYALSDNSYTR